MTVISKRYPSFEVEIISEDSSYQLLYETNKELTVDQFDNAILSLSTKNSMSDDSPAFSLVVVGKERWDTVINSNDLIRIKAIPDVTKPEPDNPYIMVGLISDVHRDGQYSDGTLLYRITGRAMTKALIDFEVGVIQEVSTIIPTVGWLPDGTEGGLKFSGNTAAGIGNELMDRFVYKYAEYKFSGGKGLKDFFQHSFTSWEEDESLADVTPFINYEGSIRQFLEDVSAKPFNELFFEYTSDGSCVALMRPTPFDQDKWEQLPTYKVSSDDVVEESFGKSDSEMYSVFVVQAPGLIELTSVDLGVFPRYHPELLKKYGYKRLDAQNRYLMSSTTATGANTGTDGTTTGTNPDGTPTDGATPADGTQDNTGTNQGVTTQTTPQDQQQPTQPDTSDQAKYEDVAQFLVDNKYNDPETLRKKRNDVISALQTQYPTMKKDTAEGIIDALKDGTFDRAKYGELIGSTGANPDGSGSTDKTVNSEKLSTYTDRLFNWYCENVNFYSGDIRIIGNPAYRVGSRLLYEDKERETTWEFYVESIQHEFSFTNGYTTVIGVTRGLPNQGEKRFTNLWGTSEEFKGGYLGESSLEDLLSQAQTANATMGNTNGGTAGGTWGGGTGSGGSMGALATARQMTQRSSKYVFGGGRKGTNIFLQDPIIGDCSSFIWWIFKLNGIELNGGSTGMNTDTIKVDPKLKLISARGSSKQAAQGMLQQGDIVYFDTYKQDGHIGIYSGNGKFIGFQTKAGISEANMASGYYWNKFNGHVRRLQ